MRLLQRLQDGGFKLTSLNDEHPPPYVILSHTWTEGQEVTHNEVEAGKGKNKTGYNKLRFCAKQAATDNYQYFWIDTCCIDKAEPVELSTAINSMYLSQLLPFPRNERFVGREEQLQSLKQTLFCSNTHSRMTVYRLGGCGKSALALEFAYHALTDRVAERVFWVPAISRDSFELAYCEIANSLRIPGISDSNANINKLVRDTLSADSSGSWLMIVDNADDPVVLQELKDMNQAEARQLLVQCVTEEALLNDSLAIKQLLSILAYLPLAIVQAAAFINSNGTSVSKYVSLFEHAGAETELFSEQFEDPSRYEGMDSTIAKTWHISFAQIRRQDPLAAEYLAFIACIDRINVPQSLLPSGGSQVQQIKALSTLTGYAFITERQQTVQGPERERFFDMHRLVYLALVIWLQEHGERAGWVCTATNRLNDLVPYGGHKSKEV
ncbi:HET-domain-containing protein [Setomelanomma holmii]|uniref:HET-domain-containing protein n=1 Tax=Setomelanomma holmii TaxID=210430 RepID=A0A9P4LHA7_9PLEO|nr:HET-domain-containing protein [Setomelanomma holmii]